MMCDAFGCHACIDKASIHGDYSGPFVLQGRLMSCLLLALCAACVGGCSDRKSHGQGGSGPPNSRTPPVAPKASRSEQLPKTVPEAVRYVMERIDEKQKADLRAIEEQHLLAKTHFGLGMWVRNELGLWKGNDELLRATGNGDPDGASSVIVHAVWEELRRQTSTSAPVKASFEYWPKTVDEAAAYVLGRLSVEDRAALRVAGRFKTGH